MSFDPIGWILAVVGIIISFFIWVKTTRSDEKLRRLQEHVYAAIRARGLRVELRGAPGRHALAVINDGLHACCDVRIEASRDGADVVASSTECKRLEPNAVVTASIKLSVREPVLVKLAWRDDATGEPKQMTQEAWWNGIR